VGGLGGDDADPFLLKPRRGGSQGRRADGGVVDSSRFLLKPRRGGSGDRNGGALIGGAVILFLCSSGGEKEAGNARTRTG
jgi:hypothetical protein